MTVTDSRPTHFIRTLIDEDLREQIFDGQVVTRFPPEPNGYLHIGHAKSICLNFGLAAEYQPGRCHLRFDDTNPIREEQKYIDSMKEDLRWLGFEWGEHEYYTSDYFEQLYKWAIQLINDSKAYVCDLTPEQTREQRGTLSAPGTNSPFRDRSAEENLELFRKMREGEFPDGAKTLRAKIDMASPNLNLRDPVMYRILHAPHHRTGNDWPIYPMYDWAHGQSDSIEGITHSICTLEFEDHRPLYDWFLEQLGQHHPRQIEFARLNLSHMVMSKRKFVELVSDGYVNGWDDPRMPTIAGLRRRGYTPESIRSFCTTIGVTKYNSTTEMALLENSVRQHLNKVAPRVMGVLRPLKVTIQNYPDQQVEMLEAVNNPEDDSAGTREVPFSKELYIERDDFMEDPPRKFFRLGPGREVRLRYGYFITCVDYKKDETNGEVAELICTYDPETRGGQAPDGRKVKGTIHWVSAQHALPAELRIYDHLFEAEDPNEVEPGGDWKENLNNRSLDVLDSARIEPSLADATPGERYQFERTGYFCIDPDTTHDRIILNRTVTLRDTWAKIKKKNK